MREGDRPHLWVSLQLVDVAVQDSVRRVGPLAVQDVDPVTDDAPQTGSDPEARVASGVTHVAYHARGLHEVACSRRRVIDHQRSSLFRWVGALNRHEGGGSFFPGARLASRSGCFRVATTFSHFRDVIASRFVHA